MNRKEVADLCQKEFHWSHAQAAENQYHQAANQQNSYAQTAAKSKSKETANAANSADSTNAPNAVFKDHKRRKLWVTSW